MGSWSSIFLLSLLMAFSSLGKAAYYADDETIIIMNSSGGGGGGGGKVAYKRECDEIYIVKEGETLHSISDKCDDPFILENNPHIQQHDDVFPGLVIKITNPSNNKSRKLLDVPV